MNRNGKDPNPDRALDELARLINEAHAECVAGIRTTIKKALVAGRLLIDAKKKAGHRNWEAWVVANCKIKKRQVTNYMAIAGFVQMMPDLEKGIEDMSIADAREYLEKQHHQRQSDQAHSGKALGDQFEIHLRELAEVVKEAKERLAPDVWSKWHKELDEGEKGFVDYLLSKPNQNLYLPTKELAARIKASDLKGNKTWMDSPIKGPKEPNGVDANIGI